MLRIIISFLLWGFLSIAAAVENNTVNTTSIPGTPVSVVPAPVIDESPASTTTTTAAPTLTTATSTTTPAANGATPPAADVPAIDTAMIEKVIGLKGRLDPATNTFKVVLPRNDLNIIVNGVKLSPAMGLTSWAVFKKTANTMTVKADLVVTENQVNTILSLALDNDLAVIALHNHLLWESPKVMFLHVEGAGDETKLAIAISKVFAKTMDTEDEASDFPLASIDTADTTLDPNQIDKILGTHGAYKEGVYQVIVARFSKNKDDPSSKLPIINTAATFAGSDQEAVIDGDFAMRASDLHAVLDALHKAGIAVVALHQHESINPQTRIVYMHYFGVGKISTLAKGVRQALDVAKTRSDAVTKPSVALLITPQPAQPAVVKTTQTAVQATTSSVGKKAQG